MSEQNKTPEIVHLVDAETMQMVIGCLGEMKLKDTGNLYLRLLQVPQMERAKLQEAIDNQNSKQPKPVEKKNAK